MSQGKQTAAMLSREAILAADDLKTETVPVPEWGGSVTVRGLSVRALVKWQAKFGFGLEEDGQGSREDIAPSLVALSVIDEAGGLMFSEDDVEALGAKSPSSIQTVFDACLRVNGLAPGADADAEKN